MGIEEIIIEMAKQEGRMEGNEIFVTNLLTSSDFDDEKIASLAGVPVAFVQGVKRNLKQ